MIWQSIDMRAGVPPSPLPRNVCLESWPYLDMPAKVLRDRRLKIWDIRASKIHREKKPHTCASWHSYIVGIIRRIRYRIERRAISTIKRMKNFFEIPEKHNLKVGDLVTCTCHGGVAVVLELYDDPKKVSYPRMNMARIWWIRRTYPNMERMWVHTINRLNIYSATRAAAGK